MAQSCMSIVGQSAIRCTIIIIFTISIEGLRHAAPKWNNKSSKVGHLVISLGQWYIIVAYQIPCYLAQRSCCVLIQVSQGGFMFRLMCILGL